MSLQQNLKLIFGLKVKQLRLDHGLSLGELSKKSGISVSYLNEIEKGKKYPKADKIALLAEIFEVSYDWMVSLQLGKKLAPIADLIRSNIINELPLDVFGVDTGYLLELLSTAPTKLNALVSTLIKIGRNYGLRVENFYHAVLRSYQEMHENYFEDLENEARQFLKSHHVSQSEKLSGQHLQKILENEYGYRISFNLQSNHSHLKDLRAVLIPGKSPLLIMNENLTPNQRAFIFGKELGYIWLKFKTRDYSTPAIEVKSFDQVLNNFKVSYFSSAIIIQEDALVKDLKLFLNEPHWSEEKFSAMVANYYATPEMFMHRLTNLIPRYFGLKQLFFLRFSQIEGENDINLSKEMHLAGLHNPHATVLNEHYCRRWVSLTIFDDLSALKQNNAYKRPLAAIQKSQYIGSKNEYLIIAMALPKSGTKDVNYSISLGLMVNPKLKKTIKFFNDETIAIREVNETCERCPAVDCKVRVARPVVLEKEQKLLLARQALDKLIDGT
ncbi:MAG: helix-turn-helix domain-containing protein [Cytophagales bacterium]|nr:helix-turn-helix domain-containing protein [Cytophagales bacterium]